MAIAKAQPAKKAPAPVQSPYYYGGNSPIYTPKPAPKPVVKAPAPVVKKPVVTAPPQQDYDPYEQGYGADNNVIWNPGPNYGADLVGDPDFTEANAKYEENVRLAHDQRRNRVRAALIKLGFQPGSADMAALEGIDPSTAQLAAQNSDSALARLGLKRGTDRADLAADLANRGLLDSGALRGGENMVQTSYDQGLLGATQDYLNEQNTAIGDEATTLATGQSAFTAAKALAAQAAAKNPLFTPTYYGAAQPGSVLAPGQGTRPDQTPVLAPAPALAKPQPKPVPKPVVKPVVKPKPKPPGSSLQGFRGLL